MHSSAHPTAPDRLRDATEGGLRDSGVGDRASDVSSRRSLPRQENPVQRARFDALRRRIFAEVGTATTKWRFVSMLPFNIVVLVLLIARGQPLWRSAVVGGSGLLMIGLLVVQHIKPTTKMATLFASSLCFFASVAVTGGIASPLVITGVPSLMAAAIVVTDPKRKSAFFVFFIGGFVLLAALSRSAIGESAVPLTAAGGWASPEFVTLGLLSIGFAALGVNRMGCIISRAYEQVAFELAERREELCTETEDRTRALEGIAARLAHEVKNPLAAIKGLSAHMARSSSDPKTAERLTIVAAEADRLQSIVDGFLSFSRGFDDLKVAKTKPFEIAREIALLLETRAADNGVTIEVHGGKDVTVNADGRKLRQALLNLVLNAIHASPEGKSVDIDVARSSRGSVIVKVSDEGVGMTAEVLDRIRKPYFTTKEGGSGLGVAVSRGLVEQHGGHLGFESEPGRGTSVTIELPVCSMKFCKGELPNPFRSKQEAAEATTATTDTTAAPAAR